MSSNQGSSSSSNQNDNNINNNTGDDSVNKGESSKKQQQLKSNQTQKESIPQLGALEEDDEFEEFAAEDWNETEEDQETHLWEDNWDDEDIEDDFSKQLRKTTCSGNVNGKLNTALLMELTPPTLLVNPNASNSFLLKFSTLQPNLKANLELMLQFLLDIHPTLNIM
ncbi:9220_t:CDS:2 [Entrophospora sp. SA101]|nr:9220_t:CDS:2 [Entrophospora sp. SA101]